jgi:ribosome maturation factor RimP
VGESHYVGLMVSEKETLQKIEHVLEPILREDGLDLVEVEFRPVGKRWLLRVFIDKPGGVTIGDCERVNRELGRVLDVEDYIEHAYTLEVSSPGLTRPVKTIDDFERYKGRLCKVVTREQIEGRTEFRGEIARTTGTEVEIKGKIDVFTIPICAIKKAHLEYE